MPTHMVPKCAIYHYMKVNTCLGRTLGTQWISIPHFLLKCVHWWTEQKFQLHFRLIFFSTLFSLLRETLGIFTKMFRLTWSESIPHLLTRPLNQAVEETLMWSLPTQLFLLPAPRQLSDLCTITLGIWTVGLWDEQRDVSILHHMPKVKLCWESAPTEQEGYF